MASAADTDIVDTGETLTVSVQVNSDKTVTATWNKITDAYYYVVWFLAYDPNYYAAAKGEFIQIGSNRGVNNTEPCTYTFGKNYTLDYAFGSSDYRIHVKAYGSTSNQIAEGYSSVFHTYIPMLASPTITLNSDGTASWTAVPDAKEYNIALYDENEMFAGGSSSYKNLTYDFSAGLTKGKSFYAEVFARNRDDGYRDSAPAKSLVIHYAPSISTFTVTGITEPVSGAAPSMNYMFPSDCGYAASKVGYGDVAWYKENGDLLNPETDRFVAGEKYRALMTLVALDGYAFADSGLTATINGETASVSVNVPKFLVTVSTWYTCPVPSGTFTVSGTVTSFLSESDSVGIFLSKASGSFPYMQYKSGNTASYSFSNISAGSYILTVNKKNHVTRQYRLNVYGNTTVNAQINPIGDISGDGKVTAKDYAMANAHVQKISELTDYALQCGDVLKADGKITAADAARINSHVQKVDSLY